jgi:glycosyltransferase involved in cell wall biosynthesis
MNMRILYDHQAFTIQEYGGISRYFYELVRHFRAVPGLKISSSLLFSNNEYIKRNKVVDSISFFRGINFQRMTEVMNLLNEVKSLTEYKSDNFDIFHPTYYDPYFLKVKNKKPIIITFHDLIHEKFKQYDHRSLAHKKSVLSRADKIITISNNSKIDLMEYYSIPEERVTIIPLASSITIMDDVGKNETNDDYVLYVGNRAHYKNFIFFVRAIAPLLKKEINLFLYCAGGGKFTKAEHMLFQELKISGKVKLRSGSDESLRAIYTNAIAFLFPSIYEGFGLPLLEAMNCGCPIGTSQTSSLPEVAGDAALYFNPYDKESILSVTETLVTKSHIRSALREKGFLRAKEFTWQKTANLTHDVYKSLM